MVKLLIISFLGDMRREPRGLRHHIWSIFRTDTISLFFTSPQKFLGVSCNPQGCKTLYKPELLNFFFPLQPSKSSLSITAICKIHVE